MSFENQEKTLKWIHNAIRKFDLEYQIEQPSHHRTAKLLDLVSTIQLATDMELHPNRYKRDDEN